MGGGGFGGGGGSSFRSGGSNFGGGSSFRSGGSNFGGGSSTRSGGNLGGGMPSGGSTMRISPGPSSSPGRSFSTSPSIGSGIPSSGSPLRISPGPSSSLGPSIGNGNSRGNNPSGVSSRSVVPNNSASSASPSRSIGVDRAGNASDTNSPASHLGSASNRGATNRSAGNDSSARLRESPGASRAAKTTSGWKSLSQGQRQQVQANLNNAVKHSGSGQLNRNGNSPGAGISNPQRAAALASRANVVCTNWKQGTNNRCFNNNWWIGRSFIGIGPYGWWGGWGYSPWLNYYPWSYWWGRPSWNACVAFLPGYGWGSGCYYDYGPGGNVVYSSGQVAVNGQVVGTDTEYAQSAAELAGVDPSELKAVEPADWMALGTFSMAVKDDEVDPARVIQLAVSNTGVVSGTIHNRTSGNTYTVQGRVDKETQRLAFTIGEDRNTVLETGVYNLTQDQTPVLCHFADGSTQVYSLFRLPEPNQEPTATPTPAVSDPTPPPPPAPNDEASPSPETARPRER